MIEWQADTIFRGSISKGWPHTTEIVKGVYKGMVQNLTGETPSVTSVDIETGERSVWIYEWEHSPVAKPKLIYCKYPPAVHVRVEPIEVNLSARVTAQWSRCDSPFALRRTEVEIGRDSLRNQVNNLPIHRRANCTQCRYESGDELCRETPHNSRYFRNSSRSPYSHGTFSLARSWAFTEYWPR